jgi:hypothetical protein
MEWLYGTRREPTGLTALLPLRQPMTARRCGAGECCDATRQSCMGTLAQGCTHKSEAGANPSAADVVSTEYKKYGESESFG